VGGDLHAPAALPPRKTRFPLYRRLGRPQGRSGRVRKSSPPPVFDSRTAQFIASCYTEMLYNVELNVKKIVNGGKAGTWTDVVVGCTVFTSVCWPYQCWVVSEPPVTRSSPRPADRHWCCWAFATCPNSIPYQLQILDKTSCTYLCVTGYLSRYSDSLWGSHPGGSEIFRTRPDRPWGQCSLLHNVYRVPSPRVKRPGCGTDQPPHLAPRLRKEYSYTPTPLLGIYGLLPLSVPLMCMLRQVPLQTCPEGGFQTTRTHISSHTLPTRSAESH
jgi:hypothetical protein